MVFIQETNDVTVLTTWSVVVWYQTPKQ